jgi:hypothetical protein
MLEPVENDTDWLTILVTISVANTFPPTVKFVPSKVKLDSPAKGVDELPVAVTTLLLVLPEIAVEALAP